LPNKNIAESARDSSDYETSLLRCTATWPHTKKMILFEFRKCVLKIRTVLNKKKLQLSN
jgi:hypothetical protein